MHCVGRWISFFGNCATPTFMLASLSALTKFIQDWRLNWMLMVLFSTVSTQLTPEYRWGRPSFTNSQETQWITKIVFRARNCLHCICGIDWLSRLFKRATMSFWYATLKFECCCVFIGPIYRSVSATDSDAWSYSRSEDVGFVGMLCSGLFRIAERRWVAFLSIVHSWCVSN